GHRLLPRRARVAAVQEADLAPGLVVVEAVLGVARGHARLAAGARVHVDVERVLLAGRGALERHELAVVRGAARVCAREALDGGAFAMRDQPTEDIRCEVGHEPTLADARFVQVTRTLFLFAALRSCDRETIAKPRAA